MKRLKVAVGAAALAGLVITGSLSPTPMAVAAASKAQVAPQSANVLIASLETELHRAMSSLGGADPTQQPKPYFLSYAVADNDSVAITAQYGALTNKNESRRRIADVQVRLGTPAQDNTHGDHRNSALTTMPLPLTDDRAAIERSLWFATNRGYAKALDAFLKVKTEQQVRAKEEDASADFSTEQAEDGCAATRARARGRPHRVGGAAARSLRRLQTVSRCHLQHGRSCRPRPRPTTSSRPRARRVTTPNHIARLIVMGRARAADGMDLFRVETFEAEDVAHLPDQKTLTDKTIAMAKNLEALREAPVTEPFNGPAILSGRASAVFFHEVLGHRLEGQRQRGDEEGQTFTKLLGKPILPSFLSVADDPTKESFNGTPLSGHYFYDDEGQQARRVDLIKDGVLETFLMSRLPIASFSTSNGHGRAESRPHAHRAAGQPDRHLIESGERERTPPDADRRGEEAGQAVRPLLRGHLLRLRRHDAPLAAGLPGDSAGGLSRLCRWPPR